MSRFRKENITCPKCGKESEFIVWESINTMLDPKLKDQLMSGELLCFTCSDCGYKLRIDYSLLYHQMEDEIMIYYVANEEEIDKVSEMLLGMGKTVAGFVGNSMDNYIKRITTSISGLLEKINIFSNGLDDKIIEIMKLFYYGSIDDESKKRLREIQFYVKDSGEMVFIFCSDEGAFASSPFIRSLYDEVAENYSEKLTTVSEKDLIIDLKWALNIF